jgi:F-type H+-transporting ATPase subunit b
MLINWFTVGAQVVNFLILVWLMRRYLYRPILNAIDTRAKQVSGVLAEADKKMSSATEQLNVYQQKVKSFEEDRARRETQVDEEITAERTKKLQSVQDDASAARQLEADDLRQKQQEFATQLGHLIETEVFAISKKSIAELADANLEHQIVSMFMHRLASLDAKSDASLGDALRSPPCAAAVTTSFDLAEGDQQLLRNSINTLASANVSLSFSTSAAMICGIELSCDGHRAAWSMADYLDGLSKKSSDLLKQSFPQDKRAAETAARPPETATATEPPKALQSAAAPHDAAPQQEEHAS